MISSACILTANLVLYYSPCILMQVIQIWETRVINDVVLTCVMVLWLKGF